MNLKEVNRKETAAAAAAAAGTAAAARVSGFCMGLHAPGV